MNLATLSHSVVSALFTMAWQAAVLVALILATQKLLGRFLPARWRFALWSLLLVRLLLPWTPGTAFSIYNLAGPQGRQEVQAAVKSAEQLESAWRASGTEIPATLPPIVETITANGDSFWIVLACGWIAGVLLVAAHTITLNARLVSRVKQGRQVINVQVLKLLEACKAETGVTMPIWIVETAAVDTPALMGFLRPRLLLPQNFSQTFTAEELRYIFLHELAHLARGDTGTELLLATLQMVHWFNPLVWFAFARMRADRELACDAYVLQVTGEVAKRRYGQALVNLVERLSTPVPTMAVVGILEDGHSIKDRVLAIARFTSEHSRAWKLGAAVLCILGLLALTDRQTEPVAPVAMTAVPGPPVSAARSDAQKAVSELSAANARIAELEREIADAQSQNRNTAEQARRALDDLRRTVKDLAAEAARNRQDLARANGAERANGDERRRGIPFEPPRRGAAEEAGKRAGSGADQPNPPPQPVPPRKAQRVPPNAGGPQNVPPVGPAGPVAPVPPVPLPIPPVPPPVRAGVQGDEDNPPFGFAAGKWHTDGTAPSEDDEIVRGTLQVTEKNGITKVSLAVSDPTLPRALLLARGSVWKLRVPAILARDVATLARLEAKVQVRGTYEDNEFVVHAIRELRDPDSRRPAFDDER